jgi:hypothetical protein
MASKWIAATLVAVACGAAACGSVGPENNVKEQFTDTLQPFVSDFKEFPFNVGKTGEYSAEILSLDPPKNLFLDVYFGVPSDLGCQRVQDNPISVPGLQALSGAIRKGTWCVGIADLGTLPQAETFVLEVSHP